MKKIVILGIENGWHCQALSNAFTRLGAAPSFVTAVTLVSPAGLPDRRAALLAYDGLLIRGIPAGSLEQIIYRMDALYALTRQGLPCVNDPKAVEKTVDKYFTTALLDEAGLPVPPTITAESLDAAMETFTVLGGDVVYKPLFGSCGKGLLHLTDEQDARAQLAPLMANGSVLYLQKYIECSGRDIRAFTVGDRVIAAMRRTGVDWRANCSRGGTAEAIRLTPAQEDCALRAARAVGAEIAGVDLLVSDTGETYVSEVNGCPGFSALSSVTDADIPGEIAAYLLAKI